MRIRGSSQQIEDRRRRALRLYDQVGSFNRVGVMLGCSPSSVRRWFLSRQHGGEAGLKVRKSPGRPRRLSDAQCRHLTRRLLRGAAAHGYPTELWTTRRIAEVIWKHFHVRYDPDHIGRLMRRLGWSVQKPARRSVQRDEAAIRRWREVDAPRIKKKPAGWAPTSFSWTNRGSC